VFSLSPLLETVRDAIQPARIPARWKARGVSPDTHYRSADGGAHGGGEADEEGVRSLWRGSHLRQEERGKEERVAGEFDDPKLTVLAEATQPEAGLLEGRVVLGVDPVIASIVLNRCLGAVESRGSSAGDDDHALLQTDQRAGEPGDDEPLGVGTGLGVIGVLEAEDVARELDDRVLEAASGADERHPALAGEPDRCQRTVHVPVRALGCNQKTGVRSQTFPRSHRPNLDSRYPLKAEVGVGEPLVRGPVGWVSRIEVSDNPNQRAHRVVDFHRSPLMQPS